MAYVGKGQKEIKTDWPHVSGIAQNQKHKGRQVNLIARGKLGVKKTTLTRYDRGL